MVLRKIFMIEIFPTMKKIIFCFLLVSFTAGSCNSETTEQSNVKTNTVKKIQTSPLQSPTIQNNQKTKSDCDQNYSGCVPIASDVDCAGGSGNGPAYVRGPISVIGSDIYGLDRDGDGLACE